MEAFGDDVLGMLLRRVSSSEDRKSCSQVCKQWFRVEGLTRTALLILDADNLNHLLLRFPNLLVLDLGKGLSDAEVQCISERCLNLHVLNLNIRKRHKEYGPFDNSSLENFDNLSDDGICSIAKGCKDLRRMYLRRRKGVGDVGAIALIKYCSSITHLDLSWCSSITDQSLKSIGSASSLKVLNVRGCSLITDDGLAALASGSLSSALKRLDLGECDRISDVGVSLLGQFCCLEELILVECGPEVTDAGGIAISTICSLRNIDLSWLINISDDTLIAIGRNCHQLLRLNLTGCELIVGSGLRQFSTHNSLEVLIMSSCYNLNTGDIEQTVIGCSSLRYVRLDPSLKNWISANTIRNITNYCEIEWR